MMRSTGFATCLMLCLAAALARAEAPYVQTGPVVYGETDGVGLLMDVFTPLPSVGTPRGLGIVCVISGAWKSDGGMLEAHRKFGFFDVLCAHGYTVFAIRPGSLSLFTAEQMLDHVHTGIRYLKAHAAEYAIAPERLGLTGASAGGHLSLLAATRTLPGEANSGGALEGFDTAVQAVGVFCPPTDFLDWGGKKYGLDLMQGQLVFRDGLANKSEDEIDAAARLISPACQVRDGLPPFLLIHGDADSLVPLQQSEKFVASVREHGGSAELIVKAGGDHSWPTVREEVEKMATWFDGRLDASLKR